MPFDGTKLAPSAEDALALACAVSGVAAIDPDALERHKAAEMERHPPGWMYRHGKAVVLAQGALLLIAAGSFCALSSNGRLASGVAVGLICLCLMMLPMFLPVRGPAQWRERAADGLDGVHPAVRERALRLSRRLDGVSFALGELFQDRVTLDPYLVADYRGVRAVVGIWDGETLIA
jgi:hypothetical protein